MRHLVCSRNGVLGGVCGGLNNYPDTDPVLIRLFAALIIFFFCFSGLLVNLIAWSLLRKNPTPNHFRP